MGGAVFTCTIGTSTERPLCAAGGMYIDCHASSAIVGDRGPWIAQHWPLADTIPIPPDAVVVVVVGAVAIGCICIPPPKVCIVAVDDAMLVVGPPSRHRCRRQRGRQSITIVSTSTRRRRLYHRPPAVVDVVIISPRGTCADSRNDAPTTTMVKHAPRKCIIAQGQRTERDDGQPNDPPRDAPIHYMLHARKGARR